FGALGVVVLAFLPLVSELLAKARDEIQFSGSVLPAALKSVYLAHSVFASEMAAPWTWPGVIATLSAAVILWIGMRHPESRRALLWLAVPLVVGLATGTLSSPRLILFGPGLVLFLAATVGFAPHGHPWRRSYLVALCFGMGWLGIATGRYPG